MKSKNVSASSPLSATISACATGLSTSAPCSGNSKSTNILSSSRPKRSFHRFPKQVEQEKMLNIIRSSATESSASSSAATESLASSATESSAASSSTASAPSSSSSLSLSPTNVAVTEIDPPHLTEQDIDEIVLFLLEKLNDYGEQLNACSASKERVEADIRAQNRKLSRQVSKIKKKFGNRIIAIIDIYFEKMLQLCALELELRQCAELRSDMEDEIRIAFDTYEQLDVAAEEVAQAPILDNNVFDNDIEILSPHQEVTENDDHQHENSDDNDDSSGGWRSSNIVRYAERAASPILVIDDNVHRQTRTQLLAGFFRLSTRNFCDKNFNNLINCLAREDDGQITTNTNTTTATAIQSLLIKAEIAAQMRLKARDISEQLISLNDKICDLRLRQMQSRHSFDRFCRLKSSELRTIIPIVSARGDYFDTRMCVLMHRPRLDQLTAAIERYRTRYAGTMRDIFNVCCYIRKYFPASESGSRALLIDEHQHHPQQHEEDEDYN